MNYNDEGPTIRLTASEQSLNMHQIDSTTSLPLPSGSPSREVTLTHGSPPALNASTPVVQGPAPIPIVRYNFVNNEMILSKSRVWITVHDPVRYPYEYSVTLLM